MDRRRMIPNHLIKRLISAEKSIFESDLSANGQVLDFAQFSNGDTFDGVVPVEVAERTRKLFAQLGLSLDPSFKVWHHTLQAGINVQLQSGADIAAGIDLQLWKAAHEGGKQVGTLETPVALPAFDAAPLAEQIARLNYLLENPSRGSATLERLSRAWFTKDLKVFEAELEFQRQLGPETFRGLIDGRHAAWLPQMLPMIESNESVAFIVGALHLVGPSGLPALLRDRGFEMEPA